MSELIDKVLYSVKNKVPVNDQIENLKNCSSNSVHEIFKLVNSKMSINKLNIFDFDGVIRLDVNNVGLIPNENSIIVTGRCFDEHKIVKEFLKRMDIERPVFFNPITLSLRSNHTFKSRLYAAKHKVARIVELTKNGVEIGTVFEDDPLQASYIEIGCEKCYRNLVLLPKTAKY